jgi:hypothetical protein
VLQATPAAGPEMRAGRRDCDAIAGMAEVIDREVRG